MSCAALLTIAKLTVHRPPHIEVHGTTFTQEKKQTLWLAVTWIRLEMIMSSKISQAWEKHCEDWNVAWEVFLS